MKQCWVALLVIVLLLSACVQRAAKPEEIRAPVSPPASFLLSNLTIQPVEVPSGGTVTITVDITNAGGTEGSYIATLMINGVKDVEKSVVVADGATRTVTFSVTRKDAASYNVAVDGLTSRFTVATPAPAPVPITPAPKPAVAPKEWPPGYYNGPLIDTHLHLSPRDITLSTIDGFVSILDRENIIRIFGFHFIGAPTEAASLQRARQVSQKHLQKIISFFQPNPGNPLPWLQPEAITRILESEAGFFKGYGELPLYREAYQGMAPDDPQFLRVYDVMAKFGLIVMMHPTQHHMANLEKAFNYNREVIFLLHGPQVETFLTDLMTKHQNFYYTLDTASLLQTTPPGQPGPGLQFGSSTKEEFLTNLRKDFNLRLDDAVARWKSKIEAYPDRFMWGTDLAPSHSWHYEEEGVAILVEFSRAFIGRLAPEVQEKFAYKNAERVITGIVK